MKYLLLRLKRFCGYITGFVFLIGGLLKLMDPVGAGLVMKEYLDFLHLGFLSAVAKPLGHAFAMLESIVGIGLITGVWRKVFALAALSLQVFFTCLTALLVIFNPTMDCGCFGEALHLTHMQTFLKNVVLCVLLTLYCVPLRYVGKYKKHKLVSFCLVSVSTVIFSIYSWTALPLVDFTDYKPSAVLSAADTGIRDYDELYETRFIYEKDGIRESFDLQHLPDSTWTFVDTETIMEDKTQDKYIVNLSIYNENDAYVDSIAAKGNVMIKSIYNPYDRDNRWGKVMKFVTEAEEAGFTPIILTIPDRKTESMDEQMRGYMYFSDYKTLITLNRSNGGVTYLNNGVIIKKWAKGNTPDLKTMQELKDDDITEIMIWQESRGSIIFQCFLLYIFAIMLLL